ncbi:FlgO family outer membrane protein [Thiovibrio sp. JS02]
MKKGLQMTICCLGLVLVGTVSCATKSATQKAASPAEGQARYSAEGKAMERSAAAEEVADTASANTPTLEVNVVQVNRKESGAAPPAAPAAEKKGEARLGEVRRVPTKYNVYQYMPDTSQSLGTEILLSEISKEVAGKVYYELKEEGENNFTAKVAVVNAVPLSDLKRETEFGRVLGEYLLTDMADRGLRVTELRMGKEINILPQTGEFILSRNIGELANNAPELDYVVVSTFTNTRKTLIVQGRLIRLKDGLVKATWRYGMPLNRELLGLFQATESPYKIAVKGMGR